MARRTKIVTIIKAPDPDKKASLDSMPKFIGRNVLAKILGVSERWISNLVADGVIKQVGRGEFEMIPCVQHFVAHKEKLAADKVKKPDDPVEVERVRRMRRENDEAERVLINMDEAMDVLAAIIGPVQAALSGVPVRATDDIPLRNRIEEEITTVLNGISKRFEKQCRTLREGGDPFEAFSEGLADEVGAKGESIPGDFGETRAP
jgi:hypothetical protein